MKETPQGADDAGPVRPRIVRRSMLHNVNGQLNADGWMTQPLVRYDRSRLKSGRLRVKEWDRYLINDDEYALWLTIANFGYGGLISVQLFNLAHPSSHSFFAAMPLTRRRMALPQNSRAGTTRFNGHRTRFISLAREDERRVMADYDEFFGGDTLAVDALFDHVPDESFATVSGLADDPRAFLYRRTVPACRASGSFKIGRRVHGFSPTRSFGLFSWNRALLPADTFAIEACGQGWQDGTGGKASGSHVVGLLLSAPQTEGSEDGPGCRFATGNAVIVDGRVTHLGHVRFSLPKSSDASTLHVLGERYDTLSAWHIADTSGAVDLTFVPDNQVVEYQDLGLVIVDWCQVSGTFTGTVHVDGKPFEIRRLRGMASLEHLRRRL